jgi:hypothetical protein
MKFDTRTAAKKCTCEKNYPRRSRPLLDVSAVSHRCLNANRFFSTNGAGGIVSALLDGWRFLSDTSHKSDVPIIIVQNRWPVRGLSLWFCLLLLFGLEGSRTARAADIPNAPLTSVGQGAQSAIADLDGDHLPDSASVQSGPGAGSMSTYWIQVHVAAGLRSFPVVAPAIGLMIKARAVDGRNAADLVLTTVWSRQPVAVFRNDGHGNFSRAEPSALGSFSDSTDRLNSSTNLATVTAGVPPLSRADICAEERDLLDERSPSALIPPSSTRFPVSPFAVSHSCRAPPVAVPYL